MYQYGQDIVSAVDHMHIILERSCGHRNRLSRKHPDDVILQSIEIHLDIGDDGVIGTGGSPVTAILFVINRSHDRIGIEHAECLAYAIAVIPSFHLVHIQFVCLAKRLHFVMSESKSFCHFTWPNHRILTEIIQCRLGIVFLDGQNTREVCTSEHTVRILSLEQTAKQHDVFVKDGRSDAFRITLHLLPVRKLTADSIPFVDDEEEFLSRGIMNGR